jgi:hypothetical protein
MTSLGFRPKLLFQCDTHSASTRDMRLFRELSETILQPRKSLPGVSVRRNGSEPNNNATARRASQPTIKWPTKSNEIHTMAADTGYRNHKRHQHIYSAADHKSGAKTNEETPRETRPSAAWRSFQQVAVKAVIPKFGTHSLRHNRSWLDAAGTPIAVQQKLMRHSDTRTTLNVYGDVVTDEMAQANSKVTKMALSRAN